MKKSKSTKPKAAPKRAKPAVGKPAPEKPFVPTFDENNRFYHVVNQVIDPEVAIGIADMGIIYAVDEKDGLVTVIMTLTSMGCPAGPEITTELDDVLRAEKGVRDVEIEVVWEPAWTPDRIKPELRQMMFGY